VNSSSTHTSSLLLRLADALRQRSADIAENTLLQVRAQLPDYYAVADPEFQSAGFGALPAVLSTAWRTLENDGRHPEHLPSGLVEEAANAARTGVPWEVIDRSYGMTHEAIWDGVLDEVATWQLSRPDARLILRVSSKFLFRCFDWLTTSAGKVYVSEHDEWLDRRHKRLRELVSQAVDGLAVPDTELGYGTGQHHLGVIGWGRSPERVISAAARTLGAELLVVPSSGSAVWAWLGRPAFPAYERAAVAFNPAPGTHIALGAVERGRAGFAHTHQQAELASWISVRRTTPEGPCVTRYPDVAVEAFALADTSRARMFVRHVLGPLAGSDARSERLRSTLRAYCDTGHNSAAAAARLRVSERTVRYRIRALEDELQDHLATGLLEPWLAVRLLEALEEQSHARLIDALSEPSLSRAEDIAQLSR
jgi:PucR-like helix-turn-helix protein